MTEPDSGRPSSSAAGFHTAIPPSPRPSVASRASRSSLRRERDLPEAVAHTAQTQSPPTGLPPDEPVHSSVPPLVQQSSFGPIFALLTSSTHPAHRQTTHHPTIRYIFADDDAEVLTAALAQHHSRGGEELQSEDADVDGPPERAIVLDMVPTADGNSFEVAWASSLSPDWAVVSAQVTRMEGVDGAPAAGHGDRPGALLLKIDGVSVGSPSASVPLGKTTTPEADLQSSGASAQRLLQPQQAREGYSGLLSDFEKRMTVLRRVVEVGAERQRRLTPQDQVFEAMEGRAPVPRSPTGEGESTGE